MTVTISRNFPVNPHVTSLIDGESVPLRATGEDIAVVNPTTEEQISQLREADADEVDAAVRSARRAFDSGRWPRMDITERKDILYSIRDHLRKNAEELAYLECVNTGLPLQSVRVHVERMARNFEFFAEVASNVHGETYTQTAGYLTYVTREPKGVAGCISPWNAPLTLSSMRVASCIAWGNTCVLKPSEFTPLSVRRMVEIFYEAGLPPGVLNVITGIGEEAGAALASHKDVDFITFTGSPEVGTLVQKAAAEHHAAVTMELGGKSPQIFFADADLEAAIPVITNAIIVNSGQTCVAGSRLLVEQSAWDKVVEAFAAKFKTLVTGPHDGDYDFGALISAKQQNRVLKFIDRAKSKGIPVLAEGRIAPEASSSGFFVPPVIFGPVPTDSELGREEVFGPVLSMIPFKDEADAIRIANGTDYGLGAGVWTRDGSKALRVAHTVRSGQVYINAFGAGGGVELPFGGFKKSGHGREKGLEALHDFSTTKTIIINHG